MTALWRRSHSTKSTQSAPWLNASMPRLPVPEKRSNTRPPWYRLGSSMLKMAARTLSVVARVFEVTAPFKRLPFSLPPATRIRLIPIIPRV